MRYTIFIAVLAIVGLIGCEQVNPNFQQEARNSEFLHRSMKQLTDVIVHDIFSPPQASRIYAYASVAGYQAALPDFPEYRTLDGQLNQLNNTPQPEQGKEYCFPLASTHAFLTVGKTLIFSEDKVQNFQDEVYAEFQALQMPSATYERSIQYGQQIAEHVLAWANKDLYKETRTYPKYSITEDPGKWRPTPPDYMDGIEPHWKKIRTFVLDSPDQFPPPPPTPSQP